MRKSTRSSRFASCLVRAFGSVGAFLSDLAGMSEDYSMASVKFSSLARAPKLMWRSAQRMHDLVDWLNDNGNIAPVSSRPSRGSKGQLRLLAPAAMPILVPVTLSCGNRHSRNGKQRARCAAERTVHLCPLQT